ncbi:MAG TPA: DUF998 domain-containing protein [Actinocrinis sp.]|nr:DUF998 domain-containing protein [Actinocrinis sp.]
MARTSARPAAATSERDDATAMELAASYRFLRRAIGLLGGLLPVVVPLGYSISTGDWRLYPSISSYYYTDMRNIFVAILCATGIFLICYRYQRLDDILSYVAGATSIGIALCPPVPPNPSTLASVAGVLHVVFAAVFFVTMALICWFLFTKSDRPVQQRTPQKNVRNRIYRVCGILIAVFTALAGLSSFTPQSFVDAVHPLYWCEAVATVSFGVAWWIKGETLFTDK